MRISSSQLQNAGIAQMQRITQDLADSQEQIASGQRITRPSDDPVGAAKIIALRKDIDLRETFIRNADAAQTSLAFEENTLTRVTDVMQRIQELTLQAGGAINSKADRQFIAAEISARLEELNGLLNTRDGNGRYIFSGNKGDTMPFRMDGDIVEYHGDDGQRRLQVDNQLYVPATDSGQALFMNIPSVAPTFKVAAYANNGGDAGIHGVGVVDADALAEFVPDDLVIEFRPLEEAGGLTNFTVRRASDQRVVDGLQNVVYQPGSTVDIVGMRIKLDGFPAEGDRFAVTTTATQGLLETVARLATGLKQIDAAAQPEAFRNLIDGSLGNLSNISTVVLSAQADIGARMNTLTSMQTFHEERNLATNGLLSDVRDLDYAEAVSRLTFQSFVLEAAQQSFVRVSRLSLFNAL
ncbi:MAG: flagellar hook-associated protein FlgL [Pseudomonadales bacterium]|nr:flagellar hook-associated protein FlgL [Pseudomonadales bacterium]MCP5184733.1 flagellar hook-associated protein FlgL [Pseudomonadales bacterium]